MEAAVNAWLTNEDADLSYTDCALCGGSGCKSCAEDDPHSAPCGFCGDPNCDGSGYNCADDFYDTYNEGTENYRARG